MICGFLVMRQRIKNHERIGKRSAVIKRQVFSAYDLECTHPKGITHTFSVINTPDWVNIVPITQEGDFILVRQHRLGTDQIIVETPGGLVDHDEIFISDRRPRPTIHPYQWYSRDNRRSRASCKLLYDESLPPPR
jgi:hypothetical protein